MLLLLLLLFAVVDDAAAGSAASCSSGCSTGLDGYSIWVVTPYYCTVVLFLRAKERVKAN